MRGVRVVIGLAMVVLSFSGVQLMRARPDLAEMPRLWMNHDAGHLLVLGRQFAAGDRPYADWIDPNFPATHVASSAFAVLERWTGVLSVRLFHGAVVLVAFLGCACLAWSLSGAGVWASLAVVAGYLLAFLCPTIPATPDFGQREHVFTLVLIPWLAWRTGGWGAPPAACRILLGFLLGFLGSTKPAFLLIPAAVETVRGRKAFPLAAGEVAAVAAGVVLPFVALVLFWKGALAAFLADTVPLVLSGRAHAGFMIPLGDCLRVPQFGLVAGAGAVLGVILWRGRQRGAVGAPEGRAWGVALLLAVLVALGQRKGFAYHFIPATGVAMAGLWIALLRLVGGRGAAALAFVAAVAGFRSFDTPERWGRQDITPLRGMSATGETVMVCATDVRYSWDAYFMGLRLVGPWGIHFALPVVVSGGGPDPRRAEVAAYRERLQVALKARTPSLILVQDVELGYRGAFEGVLREEVRFLPIAGMVRLPPADVRRKYGGDGKWIAYVIK